VGGVTSGALAQFFASPTDLVKVQIQMEGKRRLLGKPPRFVKCLSGLTHFLAVADVSGIAFHCSKPSLEACIVKILCPSHCFTWALQ
jgi:hypothetical protein